MIDTALFFVMVWAVGAMYISAVRLGDFLHPDSRPCVRDMHIKLWLKRDMYVCGTFVTLTLAGMILRSFVQIPAFVITAFVLLILYVVLHLKITRRLKFLTAQGNEFWAGKQAPRPGLF